MDKQSISKEVIYQTSRSSGSGGQHVNKVETKVELLFDLRASAAFNEAEKARIEARLENRINADGVLKVSSQKYRSQLKNKVEVLARFFTLLENALKEQKIRLEVEVPKAVVRKRRDDKKHLSNKKKQRHFKKDDYL